MQAMINVSINGPSIMFLVPMSVDLIIESNCYLMVKNLVIKFSPGIYFSVKIMFELVLFYAKAKMKFFLVDLL